MGTLKKFEDLEIWQLARKQATEFQSLANSTPLHKDFKLKNQMNGSSGSVMDCIAEGFDRAGNNEFKNFLVIAIGSNGEFRSQLYRCFDRGYVENEKFVELKHSNVFLGNKIMSLIGYLQKSALKGQNRK